MEEMKLETPMAEQQTKTGTVMEDAQTAKKEDMELLKSIDGKLDLLLEAQQISL